MDLRMKFVSKLIDMIDKKKISLNR